MQHHLQEVSSYFEYVLHFVVGGENKELIESLECFQSQRWLFGGVGILEQLVDAGMVHQFEQVLVGVLKDVLADPHEIEFFLSGLLVRGHGLVQEVQHPVLDEVGGEVFVVAAAEDTQCLG